MTVQESARTLKHLPSDLMREFQESRYYQEYEESWYSHLGLTPWDQAVCGRVHEAAEHGADGRTHQESIELDRDAIRDAVSDGVLWEDLGDMLEEYMNDVEVWHEKNGSLHTEIG